MECVSATAQESTPAIVLRDFPDRTVRCATRVLLMFALMVVVAAMTMEILFVHAILGL